MPCSWAVDAHISDLAAAAAVAVDPQTKAVSPARAVAAVAAAETLASPQSAVDETRSCVASYLN